MYIRKKLAYGRTYYQVVESKRIDGKPRQKILASLGLHETVALAIKAEKKRLTRLKRERSRYPEAVSEATYGKTTAARCARLDARIAELSARIETLSGIEASMKAAAKGGSARRKIVP